MTRRAPIPRRRPGESRRPGEVLALLVLWVLFALPLVVLVAQSVAGRWLMGELLPQSWSLRWWLQIVGQHELAGAAAISLLYSLAAVGLSLVLCLPAARVLALTPFRGQFWVETLLLSPAVVPAVTTAVGNHRWLSALGLTDNVLVLVPLLSFYSYPYLLRSLGWGYRLMGGDLRRTARNLGASSLRVFWQIELPLLLPAIFAGGAIVFLSAYSDFFVVALFGGGVVRSLAPTIMPIIAGSHRQQGAVLSLLFLAAPLIGFALIDLQLRRFGRQRSMQSH